MLPSTSQQQEKKKKKPSPLTLNYQTTALLPEGSQQLGVMLLPSPEKVGFANLFRFRSTCGTHKPEEADLLLFPHIPSWPGKSVSLPLQRGNLLISSTGSQKNHQVPQRPQPFKSCKLKACLYQKTARNTVGAHGELA